MAKLHARVDVYLGETLTWERAALVEDQRRGRLRVSQRGKIVATFTDATYQGRTGTIARWTALDADGNAVEVAAAGRAAGCAKCGSK